MVVGALLALLFIRLGLWQLDRLDERRESNAVIEARSAEQPRALAALIGQIGMDPAELAFRPAIVEGEYRTDLEFFSIGRTYDDVTGTLVATPLQLSDGSLLTVIRGLVPAGTQGPPAVGYEPPQGQVSLVGRLDDGEEPSRLGESDPEDGKLTSLSRLDLEYIDAWIEGDVLPILLLLDEQTPASEPAPATVPSEALTEGSHLGYAVQWFAFAAIVVVGVGLLVRRAGTTRESEV